MKKSEAAATEDFLKRNEIASLNACSRYLKHNPALDKVWTLSGADGNLQAVIVQSKQNLLPVFSCPNIPPPYFLQNFFRTVRVHSVQGRKEDAVMLETALEKIGLLTTENTDYDTMRIDSLPIRCGPLGRPAGLVIRKPQTADMDALAALHAAYEKEEVLPARSVFSATASRLNIERICKNEEVLVAELDGCLVGKINTNAAGFTRRQIGGVYVLPDFRSRGIARFLAGEFVANIVAGGKGISLFVKKSNPAARKVYLNIGFEITGDYRVSYF